MASSASADVLPAVDCNTTSFISISRHVAPTGPAACPKPRSSMVRPQPPGPLGILISSYPRQ